MKITHLILAITILTTPIYASVVQPLSFTMFGNSTVSRGLAVERSSDDGYVVETEAIIVDGGRTVRSYINATSTFDSDTVGNLDIDYGWFSNDNGTDVQTSLSNNLTWSYTFTPNYDGFFLVDYVTLRSGSGSGINGLEVKNNNGFSQLLTLDSSLQIPLIGDNTYTFEFLINDSRVGRNGINANTSINTNISWSIVPEPSTIWAAIVSLMLLFSGFMFKQSKHEAIAILEALAVVSIVSIVAMVACGLYIT